MLQHSATRSYLARLAVTTGAGGLQATLFVRFRPNHGAQLHSHAIFMTRGQRIDQNPTMKQASRASLMICNTLRKTSKQDVQSKALVIYLAMQKAVMPIVDLFSV
jgi:hypothetical protein